MMEQTISTQKQDFEMGKPLAEPRAPEDLCRSPLYEQLGVSALGRGLGAGQSW